jgi:hypothetical protein
MASSGEDIGAALARTSALVICCDTAALDKALLDSALNACSAELQQLVLLSSMGVTRAQGGGGIFGIGGGGGAALRDGEARLRAAAAESSLDLSIIRVGHLKAPPRIPPSQPTAPTHVEQLRRDANARARHQHAAAVHTRPQAELQWRFVRHHRLRCLRRLVRVGGRFYLAARQTL